MPPPMYINLATLVLGGLLLHSAAASGLADSGHVKQSAEMYRPCLKYDGDGCSIPFGLPFFYKTQFTPSCDRHDVCYHCGAGYGIPRSLCDSAFRRNTLATCEADYLSPSPRLRGTPYSDREASSSHKIRFLQVLEEHGMEGLGEVLQKEFDALNKTHPTNLSIKDFLDWFSDLKVQVRVLAEWVVRLAEYLKAGPVKPQTKADRKDANRGLTGEDTLDEKTILKHIVFPVQNDDPKYKKGLASKLHSSNKRISHEDFSMLMLTGADSKKDKYSKWCSGVTEYLKERQETEALANITCEDIGYLTCNFFSEVYFLSVRIFGFADFHVTPEWYCNQSFVPKCLPLHAKHEGK